MHPFRWINPREEITRTRQCGGAYGPNQLTASFTTRNSLVGRFHLGVFVRGHQEGPGATFLLASREEKIVAKAPLRARKYQFGTDLQGIPDTKRNEHLGLHAFVDTFAGRREQSAS